MTIYLVRRYDGTFVRYGFNWTPDMQTAEVYTKLGQARSRVTRWSRLHPSEPLCTLLAFTFTEVDATVLDQTQRTTQLNAAKRKRDAEHKRERDKDRAEWLRQEHVRIAAELARYG